MSCSSGISVGSRYGIRRRVDAHGTAGLTSLANGSFFFPCPYSSAECDLLIGLSLVLVTYESACGRLVNCSKFHCTSVIPLAVLLVCQHGCGPPAACSYPWSSRYKLTSKWIPPSSLVLALLRSFFNLDWAWW